MACATLKRSLDWDSINQKPAKRRRCKYIINFVANTSYVYRYTNKKDVCDVK